jgi:nucleoside-diphosphate-sugar epimerase
MHVLVTGGTGVVGRPAVDHLLARGHTVRLFSRRAEEDHQQWPAGVEPYPGSVASDEDVRGAAEGCDAVLHVVGVVDESPPEATFENVNVQGTRRIVREAERSGVARLVYVSSLGADRGRSGYHRSKLAGEEIVRSFAGNWLICRPGNVYGPGDQVISLLLKMVRSLPVFPLIGNGDQPFQPIAADDLGAALALAVERAEPARAVLELAGAERVTLNQLLDLLETITDQHPTRIPVPESLALAGAGLAEALGVEVPVRGDQIIMLLEENVIAADRPNALTDVFGISPRPLARGLAELADSLPEKLLAEGVGDLHRQRYWADIEGSRLDAGALFRMLREEFWTLLPPRLVEVGAEPGTPTALEEGATLTLAVPLRGHIQVRVEEITERAITSATVEGHHLAGVIRFLVEERDERIRFEVRSYSRAAHLLDKLGMDALGRRLQRATWTSMVEEVVRRSGGRAPGGVQAEAEVLTGKDAERIEAWSRRLVRKRQRAEKGGEPPA